MFLLFVLIAVYGVAAACLVLYLDNQAYKDDVKKPWGGRMKARTKKLISYLLNRLKEPTSWAGCAIILTAFGVHITTEQLSAIVGGVTSLIGLVLYLYPQYREKSDDTTTPD